MAMKKNIYEFSDIHSHLTDGAADDRIINLDYNDALPERGYYSIGLHPWSTAGMTAQQIDEAIRMVEKTAADDRVVAVGETGIDRLRGGDTEMQAEVFSRHAIISETLGKPLIIHAVKSIEDIIRIKKEIKPRQLWIIHGFRGNKHTARQLIKQGIALSLGKHYDKEVIDVCPPYMIFHETDTGK